MTSQWHAAGAALLLLATACDRSPSNLAAGLATSPRSPTETTVLRIPRDGGYPRLYRSPSLDSIGWKVIDRLPAVQRVVGADPEEGLVFVLDRKGTLAALDLDTRRVRAQQRRVRNAAIGPDGVVFVVDSARTVTRFVRRAPTRFRGKLQGEPRELHASLNGSLLARVGRGDPTLEVLSADRQPASFPVPDGRLTATRLGDLVAVSTDTAVVLYSADPKRKPLSIPLDGGASAAAFSPSGHLLYVVGGDDKLVIIDRFGQEVLDRIDLPGRARDLRSDLYGRWLLIQPDLGDSLWVVDVGTRRFAGTLGAAWDRDLPVVSAPNTILVRRGDDLVALDLAAAGFPETGRVDGGGEDTWLPLSWHPEGETPEVIPPPAPVDTAALAEVSDSTAEEAMADSALAATPPTVWLQLSSSQNPTWANNFAANLRAAGLQASVLEPKQANEAYRVVLGPYPTREQAEEAGRGLGMPSFVITTQSE